MKTAKEWLDGWPTAHTSCVYVDESDVEAIQRDALEAAAQACVPADPDAAEKWIPERRACAAEIRALTPKERP